MTTLPRYIGLCGNPGAGKSLVQTILLEDFGIPAVDDGEVLRSFCIDNLGMTRDDVYTQEGKLRHTDILGRSWQNRELLGELGNRLESMLGEHIMPFIACNRLVASTEPVTFGSVRKTQGYFFRERGGIIIEVRNPLAGPSPFAFDKFDAAAVTHVLHNEGLVRFTDMDAARADLRKSVHALVDSIMRSQAA